jgi:hypothetical protein
MNYRLGALLLLVVTWFGGSPSAHGESLRPGLAEQCRQATVKIAAMDEQGAGSTGTGVLIDAQGYILTNFHVVGHVVPGAGVPGTLLDEANRYPIATLGRGDGTARFRWIASVVRANVRLDLAVLRIVGRLGGGSAQGVRFPHVELGPPLTQLDQGAPLWAFGYPEGGRSPVVRQTSFRGAQQNALGKPSWLRMGDELEPSLSGGLVTDSRGRLVAIPTASLQRGAPSASARARPAERVPNAWQPSLRESGFEDLRVDGIGRLRTGEELHDVAVGESVSLGSDEEQYYAVAGERPLLIQVSPSLPLVLYDASGEVVRKANGAMQVWSHDPEPLTLAVRTPGSETEARAYTVRADPLAVDDARPPPPSPPQARKPGGQMQAVPGSSSGFFVAPAEGDRAEAESGARVHGRMVDGLSGRPVTDGTVIVARPGLDVSAHLSDFLLGEISERQFRKKLVGHARTDVHGRFEIRGIPPGNRYAVAGFASGYRSATLNLRVEQGADAVDMGTIEMTR